MRMYSRRVLRLLAFFLLSLFGLQILTLLSSLFSVGSTTPLPGYTSRLYIRWFSVADAEGISVDKWSDKLTEECVFADVSILDNCGIFKFARAIRVIAILATSLAFFTFVYWIWVELITFSGSALPEERREDEIFSQVTAFPRPIAKKTAYVFVGLTMLATIATWTAMAFFLMIKPNNDTKQIFGFDSYWLIYLLQALEVVFSLIVFLIMILWKNCSCLVGGRRVPLAEKEDRAYQRTKYSTIGYS